MIFSRVVTSCRSAENFNIKKFLTAKEPLAITFFPNILVFPLIGTLLMHIYGALITGCATFFIHSMCL